MPITEKAVIKLDNERYFKVVKISSHSQLMTRTSISERMDAKNERKNTKPRAEKSKIPCMLMFDCLH